METATPSSSFSATTVYDASRLSVGELFNAQAAQATYQRLVDVINAQAAAMERLARRVGALETTQRHAVAAQQHTLQQMDAAVVQIERLHGQQERTREAQREHGRRLDTLVERSAADRSTLADAAQRVEKLERRLEEEVQRIHAEMAPMDLVSRLQADQHAMHDRVAAVETRVESKLEKSELTRLDGVVAKIQTFVPTATMLTNRVTRLERSYTHVQQRVDEGSEATKTLGNDMATLQASLREKVDVASFDDFRENKVRASFERLQQETDATQGLVNQLVHRGVALETNYRTLSSKLSSVAAAMTTELNSIHSHVTDVLSHKLGRSEMDSRLNDICHELSCKAWRKDTQVMHSELSDLKTKFRDMELQVDLSTRFLDWFATRGESYERNLDVVEHQLERLAFASAPQNRQPFAGQVRFPQ